MRVQIIEEESKYDLEKRINSILSLYDNEDIIDIKYSGRGNHAPYSIDYYSAMIIFKK